MLSTSVFEGQPELATTPALRVAVIGAGRWGANLIRAFRSTPSACLEMVCDSSVDQLRAIDGPCDKFQDFQEVLGNSRVDAIAIATPPSTHSALAVAALDAGKHVFVEKPMAIDMAGALAVRAAAAQSSRRVMVGYVLRYHPAVSALISMLDTAAFGTPIAVLSHRGGGRQPGAAHPAWWSLAPHDVSLAELVFGKPAKRITAAENAATGEQRATISYGGTGQATLLIEPRARRRHRRFIVLGTRGTAVFDDLEPQHKLKLFALALDPQSRLQEATQALESRPYLAPSLAVEEPLKCELEHFVRCIAAHSPFRTDIDHAVSVVNTLAAGERSIATDGGVVPVANWRQHNADSRQA